MDFHIQLILLSVLALFGVHESSRIATSLKADPLEQLYSAERDACMGTHGRPHPACRRLPNRVPSRRIEDKISVHDSTYMLNITVGYQSIRLRVAIDSGSRELWLTSPRCDASCAIDPKLNHTRTPFPYQASSTFRSNYTRYKADYKTATVQGFLGEDDVFIGPLKIPGQDLLIAEQMTGMSEMLADGFVGLSFPRRSPVPPLGVLERLREQIPLYTIALNDTKERETEYGGQITFGSYDKENCPPEEDVVYLPLHHLEEHEANEFNLWLVKVNAFTHASPLSAASRRPRVREEGPWDRVAVDTGATVILGPYEEIDGYAKANGADEDGGFYRLECDAVLVPMLFEMEGGKVFDVGTEQLIIPHPNTTVSGCVLTVEVSDGKKGSPDWILGAPFLRRACAVFDIAKSRLGLAPRKK